MYLQGLVEHEATFRTHTGYRRLARVQVPRMGSRGLQEERDGTLDEIPSGDSGALVFDSELKKKTKLTGVYRHCYPRSPRLWRCEVGSTCANRDGDGSARATRLW
jgi:hypothetical protein